MQPAPAPMTSAPTLPPGWRNWPAEHLEELLTGLQALASERSSGKGPWLCDLDECDGMPHAGRRNRHARTEQRPPAGDWDYWNLFAGRGFGKTRTGAEWVIGQARVHERGALVGPTAADVRDTMVEGESGILACSRASFRPEYQPSKRRLVYPNGAMQFCYSADEPERLRGPQHHYAWADELAAWRYLQYAWDMLSMGLRLGQHPQVCTTTTPRPLELIKELRDSERAVTVTGSTYANLHNLAPTFTRTVLDRYAGTTLGRQELDAEILDDLPDALVRRGWIEQHRVTTAPDLDMLVVSVDPAGTGRGDEAGLLVVGRGRADRHFYVLADLSALMSARQTALAAWRAVYEYEELHPGVRVVLVYEDNYGKQWLRDGLLNGFADHHGLAAAHRQTLMDAADWNETARDLAMDQIPNPYRYLRNVSAQHGKELRAQPVAMRYEQGRVHHVGSFPRYEDQLTTWNPHSDKPRERESPDRIDAAVHGVTYLMGRERTVGAIATPHQAGIRRAAGRGAHPLVALRRRAS